MSQGKAWDKEKAIELLKPLLKLGYSVTKSCKLVGIPQSTVATWISDDEILRLKVIGWTNEISLLARQQWQKSIVEGKPGKFGPDIYTPAKEWLERREREDFSPTQNVNVEGGFFSTNKLEVVVVDADKTEPETTADSESTE